MPTDGGVDRDAVSTASAEAMDRSAPDDAAEIERLRRRIQDLPTDFEQIDRRARDLVRQRPLLAVGAALVIGLFLGRAVRRR
jgi:ElaB/YqjD/DUF883 family membrane-anchored ribosome-binding protein